MKFTCPKCKSKLPLTFKDIEREKEITCKCNQVFKIKGKGSADKIKKGLKRMTRKR